MKALVTGGAGFIGSHIAEHLIKNGWTVAIIDDLSAGKRENLPRKVMFYEADVTDNERLDDIFSVFTPDVVFHNAASKKNVCLLDPMRDLEVNAKGTFNLLELSQFYKVKKFVHASTGSVYGEVNRITEETRVKPVSYYGVSKLAGENYVRLFPDLNPTILRYFHVYGPNQDNTELGGVVSIFINNLLTGKPHTIFGDGKQVRSFTYVKDVIEANLMALNMTGIYNVASGAKVSLIALAEKLESITGLHYGYKFEDRLSGDIDNFDVKGMELDKRHYTSLDLGLYQTILTEKLIS